MRPVTFARAVARDLRGRETEPRSDATHRSATVEWLHRSQDVTADGGSAAAYSLLTGWAGPYPETSGYLVPTLFDYAAVAEAPAARERATAMAEWLRTQQREDGAFPEGVDPGPDAGPSVFNTGQIVLGLVRAHRETGDDASREAVERAGRWLCEVQHPEGYWDRYEYRGEKHAYCSRVAWALLEARDVTGIEAFSEAARRHLDWVLTCRTDTDWFECAGFSPDEVPYLHTIAYTVRGLLESATLLDDDAYRDAAIATADRLLSCQERDGVLRGAYDRTWAGGDFHCPTGNAQVALVWLGLFDRTGEERYREAAASAIAFLKRQQVLDGPGGVAGGLKGSNPVWGPYMRLRYPNWAAKFFLDCLLDAAFRDR